MIVLFIQEANPRSDILRIQLEGRTAFDVPIRRHLARFLFHLYHIREADRHSGNEQDGFRSAKQLQAIMNVGEFRTIHSYASRIRNILRSHSPHDLIDRDRKRGIRLADAPFRVVQSYAHDLMSTTAPAVPTPTTSATHAQPVRAPRYDMTVPTLSLVDPADVDPSRPPPPPRDLPMIEIPRGISRWDLVEKDGRSVARLCPVARLPRDAPVVEPVWDRNRAALLVVTPPGRRLFRNGLASPPITRCLPGDHLQVDQGPTVLLLEVRCLITVSGSDLTEDSRCAVCRLAFGGDSTVARCPCGEWLHLDPELSCGSLGCPSCSRPLPPSAGELIGLGDQGEAS